MINLSNVSQHAATNKYSLRYLISGNFHFKGIPICPLSQKL